MTPFTPLGEAEKKLKDEILKDAKPIEPSDSGANNSSENNLNNSVTTIAKDATLGAVRGIGKISVWAGSKLNSWASLLFWLFLIIHLLDWWVLNFNRPKEMLMLFSILSLIIGVFLAFLLDDDDWWQLARTFLMLLLLTTWLPFFIGKITEFNIKLGFIWFLYAFAPAIPVWILMNSKTEGFQTFKKWYMFLWVLIAMVLVISSFSLNLTAELMNSEAQGSISSFWESLTVAFGDTFEKITGLADTTWKRFNGSLDVTYYTGAVESNSNANLGVKFAQVRATDPFFSTTTQPTINGYIDARSFLSEYVWVEPSCSVYKGDIGTVDPIQMKVYPGLSSQFLCRLPVLKKGAHTVEMAASFDFSTWADLTYTFVNEQTVIDYSKAGTDIRHALGIKPEPLAVYTNGPVHIGMGGSMMPLVVTPTGLSNARLGMTIESKWKGEINNINSIKLKVPKAFTLSDCDKGDPVIEKDPQLPEYDTYVFENIFQKGLAYTTITCKLDLEDPNHFNDLLTDKFVERTFIATVDYRYTISEKTQIQVQ